MIVCNVENTIADSVNSVLKQSFKDFELVIVNAGSTDNTSKIIGSFDDKRIRLTESKHDKIQSLNLSITLSTGNYIALMDTNSIMHVDRLKMQYEIMENFPEITICSSWEAVFGEKVSKKVLEQKVSGLIELPLIQLLDDIAISSTYTIRRSFINDHNIAFESFDNAVNYKFWTEIAKFNGGFYIDSQPLNYKRIDSTNILLRKQRLEWFKSILKIKKEIILTLCEKYYESYPAFSTLYNSYCDLSSQGLISENDIYKIFYSIFIKNKDIFNNLP